MATNGKCILSGGALTVDSLTTAVGAFALDSSGNLAVNTSKLTVAAASGDLAINTNKFTVAGASGNTLVAGTLAVTGASTLTGNVACAGTLDSAGNFSVATSKLTVAAASGNTASAGSILSTSATGGVGYGTGAGGAVTQSTDKTTGVTLNKACGTITLNNASLAAATSVGFTLTNSVIAATDVVVVSIKSGATADSYTVTVDATAAGSCRISLRNVTAGALVEAVVLNYVVIKGVAA